MTVNRSKGLAVQCNHPSAAKLPARSHRLDWLAVIAMAMIAMVVSQALSPSSAEAQSRASVSHGAGDFGLGLIIGDPTGINGKYFLSQELAVDGSLGFGFIGGRHTKLQFDFLWHFGLERWQAAGLDLYVGVGPTIAVSDGHYHNNHNHAHDDLWIGARVPFGASLTFNKVPFDIFLEIAAELWVVEHAVLDLDAALGFRYWF